MTDPSRALVIPPTPGLTLHIPTSFWFTSMYGSAIPLVWFQQPLVRIQVRLAPWVSLVGHQDDQD